ncbi:hypothetical protein JXC34_04165 [Candidatus Woesearchaeota archaeon]|nr:hypothetical protein [Candidatus Woesearchaeota archaeon]
MKQEKEDYVMDLEQRKAYVFDRKLSPNAGKREEQIKGLKRIVIHNAFTMQEIEKALENAEKYYPGKSTEPHFMHFNGDLHVVNSRGIMRGVRDEDLVHALGELIGKKIELEVRYYKDDIGMAFRRFKEFSFNQVAEIFRKIDKDAVKKEGGLYLLFGPHKSLSLNGLKPDFESVNDYLNYKLLHLGKKTVVAFDYIFADQARNVLGQIYSSLNSYFSDITVNVFHYGKIGLLDPARKIGDICIPVAALDENKIIEGDCRAYPISNQLCLDKNFSELFASSVKEKTYQGTTVNTISVLRQTRKALERDLKAGGNFLDMEWLVMSSLDHGFKSNYPRIKKINNFFAGIGSDKPLEGRTLADTEYPADKEKKIADAFVEIIKRS